jgi:hypothetical protein
MKTLPATEEMIGFHSCIMKKKNSTDRITGIAKNKLLWHLLKKTAFLEVGHTNSEACSPHFWSDCRQ